jgi:hypothetical protein
MMFKEAAMMSSEVMALSKSKNSCKSRAELPKKGRVFVDGICIVRRMPVLVSSTFEDFQTVYEGEI